MTEIAIGGAGTFGGLQPGWTVNEDATPVAIGDSSGAITSASLTVSQGEDSEFLVSESAELSHESLGSFFGTTSTATSNGATEETDTTIPVALTGIGKTLTSERTAAVIAGGGNMASAGLLLNSGGGQGVNVGHIAVGPSGDSAVYRLEAGPTAGAVSVSSITPSGQKTSVTLSGAGVPTDYMLVTGFAVTPTLLVLFYTVAGVRRLGFFDKTTGVIVNVIGSNGTGNSQFGTGPNTQRIYWSPVNNRVYVTDFGNNRVQIFSSTGTFVSTFAHTRALAISGGPSGIYVSDASTTSSPSFSITEYSFDGLPTGRIVPAGSAYSFTVSPTGNTIATISSDSASSSAIKLYDIATGRQLSATDSTAQALGGALYVRSTLVANPSFVYVTVLNSDGYQTAMIAVGQTTLYTAFAYYASLGGVNSISFQVASNPLVQLPGWMDSAWNKIKELAAAQGVEVAAVEGVFVVRDMGTRILDLDNVQGGSVSLGLSTNQGARSVSISWDEFSPSNDDVAFFTIPQGEVIRFSSGDKIKTSVQANGQPSLLLQPIYGQDYLVMGIFGDQRWPISRQRWEASGASLSVALDPSRPGSIDMTIVAPLPITDGPRSYANFELGANYPLDRESIAAENLAANPRGISGTGWSNGSNLSPVYSGVTYPTWTLLGSGLAFARIPIASTFYAGVAYRAKIRLTVLSGSITTANIIQGGGLPNAVIGTMTIAGGVLTWEGSITPAATTVANPEILFDLSGAVGTQLTLAEPVLIQRGGGVAGLDVGFDGDVGPAGYLYRWTEAPLASPSQKYSIIRNSNNLEVYGRGLVNLGSGSIDLLTGADPTVVGAEKASDVASPFINSRGQAYDRGVWRAEQINGVSTQLNATVPINSLEGFGLTAGSLLTFKDCIYRIISVNMGNVWANISATRYIRQSDVQPIHAGKTMGAVDSAWAGTKYKDQLIKPLKAVSAVVTPVSTAWAAWGSSSVAGLGPALTAESASVGATFFNGGVGGWTAEHILSRFGSRPATFAAFTVPASGAVTVFPQNLSINNVSYSIPVTIGGIAGTLARTFGTPDIWSFTRAVAGTAALIPAGTPAIPTEGATRRGDVAILNIGKNNIVDGSGTQDMNELVTWTYEASRYVTTPEKRVIVMGHFVNTNTPAVSVNRDEVAFYNRAMEASFGEAYIDMHSIVTSAATWAAVGVTPTPTDLAQQAIGNKPPSLSLDDLHLNTIGNNYVASVIRARIQALGWA